jgi:hypothetical protein
MLLPIVSGASTTHSPPWPFKNMSKYLLMNWFHTGSNHKSEGEITRLAKEVIRNVEFKPEDLAGFCTHWENKQLDDSVTCGSETLFSDDNWKEVSIEIEVPVLKTKVPLQRSMVPGLHHRSIIQVIKATWGAVTSKAFHLTPSNKSMPVPAVWKLGYTTRFTLQRLLKLHMIVSKSSLLRLGAPLRRSLLASCFGQILRTSQILVQQRCGHYTCTLLISPST